MGSSRRLASLLAPLALAPLLLPGCSGDPEAPGAAPVRESAAEGPAAPSEDAVLSGIERAERVEDPQRTREETVDDGTLTVLVQLELGKRAGEAEGSDGIWVLDPEEYDRAEFRSAMRRLRTRRAWELVEEFGTRVAPAALDARGTTRAVIPRPGPRAEIRVRAAGFTGTGRVRDASDGRLAVELDRAVTRTAKMTVVDVTGAPVARVPVCAVPADEPYAPQRGSWVSAPSSDGDGAVTLVLSKSTEVVVPEVLGARVASKLEDGGEVLMPPHGSLLLEFEGEAPTGRLEVKSPGVSWNRSRFVTLNGERSVRVERIGLGQRLQVRGRIDQGSVFQELEGPKAQGETVLVPVDPTPFLRIEARLIDEGGHPVVGIRSFVEISEETWNLVGVNKSDERGRISVKVNAWQSLAEGGCEVTLYAYRRASDRYQGPYASVKAPAPDEEGVIHLGDVTLVEQPLFFSGVVVTPDGEPVPKAWVRWSERFTGGEPGGRSLLGIGGGTGASAPRYEVPKMLRADEQGRFKFKSAHDQSLGGGWELVASASASGVGASEATTFEVGDSELRLVLEPTDKR